LLLLSSSDDSDDNPPCILHMHNRIALKKLTVVLKHGLSNALAGILYEKMFSVPELATLRESLKKCFDRFISTVEALFNTEIWGTDFAPCHWHLPVDSREKRYVHCVLTMNAAKQQLSVSIH
jgi:hypothetical protein